MKNFWSFKMSFEMTALWISVEGNSYWVFSTMTAVSLVKCFEILGAQFFIMRRY